MTNRVVAFFKGVSSAIYVAIPYFFGIGENRKEVTEQYPDPVSSKTKDDLPKRYRGILYNDIETCIGCFNCQQECPCGCFAIRVAEEKVRDKNWVSQFDLDISKCVFCGKCTEVCPTGSLVHTVDFEFSVYQKENLVLNFGKGDLSS